MAFSNPERYQEILREIAAKYPNEYHFSSPATYFGRALREGMITKEEYDLIYTLHGPRRWDWTGD